MQRWIPIEKSLKHFDWNRAAAAFARLESDSMSMHRMETSRTEIGGQNYKKYDGVRVLSY